MAKRWEHSYLETRVGRRALLLFAAIVAVLLAGVVFVSTAQATVSVKNTSNGDSHGYQRGVAADVDAGYFQGVPYGYTPSMAVRMNNSWGTNRYLELKMTFTSRGYTPYRLVYLALTKDGATLFNYAISDPSPEDFEDPPLIPHTMEIFEVYETSTDGYWDAYFDHVCLTLPPLGPVKWYLHDHGTTSETKVVCPSYPQGEWARFVDIKILDRYWNWVYQTTAWPVTVVDDNAYFNLAWETPNQSWKTSPSVAVEPDGWELSTWGQYWLQENDAGISPYLDNGFRAQFGAGWTKYIYSTYGYPGQREGSDVWERDLRDPGKNPYPGGSAGTANTGFDKADLNLWASHADTYMLDVNGLYGVFHDWHLFEQQYARWGKYDAEWDYILACHFTGWDGDQWTYDYGSMAGLHVLCGFASTFGCPNPDLEHPQDGADWAYGKRLAQYLQGAVDGQARTVVKAFEQTAWEKEGSGHTTRCLFTPTTLYDHLNGYGSFAINDPTGWMMGGLTYYRDFPF
jgi:hypothetical protein